MKNNKIVFNCKNWMSPWENELTTTTKNPTKTRLCNSKLWHSPAVKNFCFCLFLYYYYFFFFFLNIPLFFSLWHNTHYLLSTTTPPHPSLLLHKKEIPSKYEKGKSYMELFICLHYSKIYKSTAILVLLGSFSLSLSLIL